jgi:transcriptional regulator with XRE-family HTH domain
MAVLKYRYDHGLSQTALGRLVGMTQPQIWRIEEGEHNPSMETLTRLCDGLGLEISLTIGPKADVRREVPAKLQRNAVCDATDQVVISVREA